MGTVNVESGSAASNRMPPWTNRARRLIVGASLAASAVVAPSCVVENDPVPELGATPDVEQSRMELVVEAARNLALGKKLTAEELALLTWAGQQMEALSAPSRAAAEAFYAEQQALGIPITDLEAHASEFQTMQTAEYRGLVIELSSILDWKPLAPTLPSHDGENVGKVEQPMIWAVAALLVELVVVWWAVDQCKEKAITCADDVATKLSNCLKQTCPDGKQNANAVCCATQAKKDKSDCGRTCGIAEPDWDDYEQCCPGPTHDVFEY